MGKERYKDWMSEAYNDVDAARILANENKYSKVCFLCQQASEKVLKALLIKKYGKYEEVHSVKKLLEFTDAEELIDAGKKLDRFYIPPRYLNAWPEGAPHEHYTEEDSKEALELAGKVIDYVERKLRENS